jgi:hypothetical protein
VAQEQDSRRRPCRRPRRLFWAGFFGGQDGAGEPDSASRTLFGGTAAPEARHPLPGVSAENCTEQLGVAGTWAERLAHFRMAFTPSSGGELQSEFFVPREHAVAAVGIMRGLSESVTPLLQVAEIRTVARDRLWLSPAYGQASVGLHFTWKPDQDPVERVLPLIEDGLAPLGVPALGQAVHSRRRHPGAALSDVLPTSATWRREWIRRASSGTRSWSARVSAKCADVRPSAAP